MRNKFLITTALVAMVSASNVYAEVLPENATDLTTGDYVVEDTGSSNIHYGDIKISQDATLEVNTYADVDEEQDKVDVSHSFAVAGDVEVGDAENGGGRLSVKREDAEKPFMIINGNLTVNEAAELEMSANGDFFSTINVAENAEIKGGTVDMNGAEIFVNKDFNISGGDINIERGGLFTQATLSDEDGNASPSGDVLISGGSVSLNGVADIGTEDGKIIISGGQVDIVGEDNSFSSVSGMFLSGGELNIQERAELDLLKEFELYDETGKIVQTGGDINLFGTLNGDIEGEGNLNVKSSNALVNGDVSGSKLSFDADHSLSKAISGTIGDLASLNVNKGTLTYDKQTGKIGELNVAGGLDIGTNTVNATNVDFADESNLALRVASTDSFGNINADSIKIGTDTTMKVTLDNGVVANGKDATFKLLNSGNVEGSFTNKIAENSRYDIAWNDDGSLKITGTATASDVVADAGGSANNAQTAEAWDSVASSSAAGSDAQAVASALNDLSQNATTAAGKEAYVDALTAVAPEVAPAVQQTSTETANQVFGAVGTRLTGGSVSTGGEGMSSGDSNPDAAVWVQGMFNKSKLDDTSKAKGFDADSNGVAFGAEKYVNDDVKAGIGYAYTKTDIDGFMRSTDVDTHTAIVYGEYKPSNWYVNGIATYGWSDYSEDKNVAGVGVKADYDVKTLGLQAMTGYDMNVNGFGFTPEAGLRYVHVKQDGYTDSADQRVSANDSDILTAVIGARFGKNFGLCNGMNIKPEARIAVTYDLMNDDANSVVTLANGSAYSVNGEALDRFGMEFGAGVTAEVNDNTEVSLAYEGKFRQDYQDHTGLINAKYKF